MLRSDELAFAEEELHDHHFIAGAVQCEGIDVFARGFGDHALFLDHVLNLLDGLEEGGGFFELQLVGGFFHFIAQMMENFFILAFQKVDGPLDKGVVLLFGAEVDAGGDAPFDPIEQAGPRAPFQLLVGALAQRKEAAEEVVGLACGKCARIGPEIKSILRRLSLVAKQRNFRPGMLVIHHEADERLIIFEKGVVFRLVFFDEGVFQQESFAFGRNDDRVDVSDLLHEEGDHGTRVAAWDEILFDAGFEIFRFAHIDDDLAAIFHQIDAAVFGEVFEVKKSSSCFSLRLRG